MEEKTLKQREEKMREMELLYREVLNDNKEMSAFLRAFMKMKQRKTELANFYHGEWLEDSEVLANQSEIHFEITNQDSIYEALTDQYFSVIKILKQCAIYIDSD
jgi:hypothetical protein